MTSETWVISKADTCQGLLSHITHEAWLDTFKVHCVGLRGIYLQKWNIYFTTVFLLLYNYLKLSFVGFWSPRQAIILHCHVSTVAQNRQTKQWLVCGAFVFLVSTVGEGETGSIQLDFYNILPPTLFLLTCWVICDFQLSPFSSSWEPATILSPTAPSWKKKKKKKKHTTAFFMFSRSVHEVQLKIELGVTLLCWAFVLWYTGTQ